MKTIITNLFTALLLSLMISSAHANSISTIKFEPAINSHFSSYIADCTPPSNQPTNLKVSAITATTVKLDFTAATPGTVAADKYLVVFSTKATPQLPASGTSYNPDDPVGTDSQAAYYGTDVTCTVQHLQPNTKYYFYVYSVANAGVCYNTTRPLTGTATTINNTDGNTSNNQSSSQLSPLLNFNFAGSQNGWSNLTPVVFYGWSISGETSYKNKAGKNVTLWGNTFQVGPYIGSTIAIKDSSSYLPAVMLPGNAGIEINYFLTFGDEKKFSVVIAPLNLGLKVISGFTDTSLSLVQHNIRHSIGIRYGDQFSASAQFTQAWYNITTQSEQNYSKIFPGAPGKMTYWNVTFTSRLSQDIFGGKTGSPLYLSINWRSLTDPAKYGKLPNYRFISVGLITNLNLKSGSNPGLLPKAPNL